jgi:serine/threonine protein kinase
MLFYSKNLQVMVFQRSFHPPKPSTFLIFSHLFFHQSLTSICDSPHPVQERGATVIAYEIWFFSLADFGFLTRPSSDYINFLAEFSLLSFIFTLQPSSYLFLIHPQPPNLVLRKEYPLFQSDTWASGTALASALFKCHSFRHTYQINNRTILERTRQRQNRELIDAWFFRALTMPVHIFDPDNTISIELKRFVLNLLCPNADRRPTCAQAVKYPVFSVQS